MMQGQEITVRFSISSLINGVILVGMMWYFQYKLNELDKKYIILEENLLKHLSIIKDSVASLQATNLKAEMSAKIIEVPTPIVAEKTIFSFFYDNPYIIQTLIIIIGGVTIYFIGTSLFASATQPVNSFLDKASNSGFGKIVKAVDHHAGNVGSYFYDPTNVGTNIVTNGGANVGTSVVTNGGTNIVTNGVSTLNHIQCLDTNGNIIRLTHDGINRGALSVKPNGSNTFISLEDLVSNNGQVVLQNTQASNLLASPTSERPFKDILDEIYNNYSHGSRREGGLILDSEPDTIVENIPISNISNSNTSTMTHDLTQILDVEAIAENLPIDNTTSNVINNVEVGLNLTSVPVTETPVTQKLESIANTLDQGASEYAPHVKEALANLNDFLSSF